MSENPYQSPSGATERPDAVQPPNVKDGKQPFSLQAAKFSLIAPFFSIAMNLFVSVVIVPDRDGNNAPREVQEQAQVRFAFGILSGLVIVAGFVLGAVGIVGGIARSAIGTIVMSIFGVLINGSLIGSTVWAIIRFSGP